MGNIPGEKEVMRQVLRMNGIVGRHYAQDTHQTPTHDVYELGTLAAMHCLDSSPLQVSPSYLAAGTTHCPLSGPGLSSIIHRRLADRDYLNRPAEISSHSGICTSSSAAFVGAVRAVKSGDHDAALCLGTEHASEILKSTRIRPTDDRDDHVDLRTSQWFMSVFLRFMLSDGAGAFLLQNQPSATAASLQVNWTHSVSFAHAAPLCMKLENETGLLTQDVKILSRYMFELGGRAFSQSLQQHGESLDEYAMILPHMSSFFFRRKMERVIASHCANTSAPVPYWTNLADVGNTGAASIYVMLDHYLRSKTLRAGERLLLFIPESGQFNFVLVSLTVVLP
ncbi:3-oxoacyl-[acyl-carrier-protein] synthase III C-terminal domain-containing protein [Rhodopirellula sp. P2]|uniref:3-oxoacyl-[acyl-carrier-protein] synthase III C-terminal domain-containing protein n=1 Tax=Rhodopirellula sp. P2 TaxID=2127060 RepID=UPI0023674F0A|nr:hypothetical protein [Rhodopirellula sp. P2]WDQ15134.1 hypothetical protein PSR62_15975 [Rhodopirellula sp. P2]